MITYIHKEEYRHKDATYFEAVGLSTDTKPDTVANGSQFNVANGSTFIEMDTGSIFFFDETGGQWLNFTRPGGD